MRHALPLWCCLDADTKLGLLYILKRMGDTEFNEPLPIWKEFTPIKKKLQFTPDGVNYGKFMRQRPRHSKLVK